MRLTKAHKYHAKATVVDGVRFHSKREAARYQELKLLEKAGEIRDLELQPKFALHVPQSGWHSAPVTIGHFVADFRYREANGMTVVEDVKGMKTLPLARWKHKHLLAQYGIRVREVR